MSEFEKCLVSAQRSLAMREHSYFQIKNKLCKKGFEDEIVENVLMEIKKTGFQSDKRYTEEYIRHKQGLGYGSKKIIYDLKSNGISSNMIEDNLENFIDDYNVLFELVKFKNLVKNLNDEKNLAKFINKFRLRGFEHSTILEVINNIKTYEK